MSGSLAQAHAMRLETLRQLRHVAQGEDGSITLQKREAGTGALSDLLRVGRSWAYGGEGVLNEIRLPQNVIFELQVAETEISKQDLRKAAAVKHGRKTFKVIRPSPFDPVGFDRFWRFWLAPAEELKT